MAKKDPKMGSCVLSQQTKLSQRKTHWYFEYVVFNYMKEQRCIKELTGMPRLITAELCWNCWAGCGR